MTQQNPSGLRGDISRLKEHGGTTVAELQDFVRQLHGRSPSEVLGIVSGNLLIRSLLEATAYMAVLIALLTVIPFMLKSDAPPKAAATPAAVNAPASTTDATAPVSPTTSDDDLSEENAQKAVEVMGLGETKTADPDKNPLDNLDNLLDDVK
ncbi:MAG: hypothetical protein O2955_05015 [Planctomycetota bacterium]|nr:hypothetical protein [Planctomycetota bacterium]MDA1211853.1 hypothetical protein [Planctomycetota bacterium]